MAEPAEAGEAAPAGPFERDTAVSCVERDAQAAVFDATVADGWRAGRGPHGGYLAAMLLRALIETVDDEQRSPRSLTIHYARAPEPGPVVIRTAIERAGRSLSTLSARLEQDGRLMALVLGAFSVPWQAPEVDDLPLPDVEGPDPDRQAGTAVRFGAPPFTKHLILQPRFRGAPLSGERRPMELGAWVGLAEPRPLDALAGRLLHRRPDPVAVLRDRRAGRRADDRPHDPLPRAAAATRAGGGPSEAHQLCYAQMSSRLLHEGFFEEDGVVWAADGTVLAQSRQLALLMPVG